MINFSFNSNKSDESESGGLGGSRRSDDLNQMYIVILLNPILMNLNLKNFLGQML